MKGGNDAVEDGDFLGNEEKNVSRHQRWNPCRASDAGDAESGHEESRWLPPSFPVPLESQDGLEDQVGGLS